MCPAGLRSLSARFPALIGACLLLALLAPGRVAAQEAEPEFAIRSWERRQGVPATVINQIQRAPNGYLWLATQAGLVRFDGERFKVFDTDNHPEFRTNWASCVLAASNGEVWLGTPAGLFHPPKGKPEGEKWVETGSRLPVNALAAGAGGILWALSASNQVIEIADGKLQRRLDFPGDQPPRLLLCAKSGGLLAASPYHAFLLQEGRWLPLSQEVTARIKPDLLCRSEREGFWCAAGRGVARLVETGGTLKLTPLETGGEAPASAISALIEDHAGRLWAGTRRGAVYCLQPANSGGAREAVRPTWRQVTPKRLRSLGPVSCLYEDSEGLVWVGTTGGYLHQIKPRLVTMWSLPTLTQQNVPHTVCVARDGAVWIGTDGAGAYRFEDGTVSRFGAGQGLTDGTVIAMLEDRHTNLWCGTFGGLFRWDGGRFKAELDSVFHGQPVPALFEDRAGDLWFGTIGAVVRQRGDDVTTYSLGSGYLDSEVRAIVEGRQGEVWIGTRGGGIFRLEDGRMDKFERFRRPLVQTLHCDAKGNLWVGTATRGLFRVAGNRVNTWSRADGLPSAWINSILEDSAGTLWLGSNIGVFGVTKQALMARLQGAEAPLLTIQVAASEAEAASGGSGQPSAAKGADGRLWFPTARGVLSFDPAELMRHRPELPVLIEEVLVDGVERVFDEARSLKVYAGLKRLEFRYTIADLDSPGRLRFRYKLEGLDERWVDAGAQRSATYGPLAPGHYRFRVIAAGSANVWTETTHPLSIRVVVHFWQTLWFRAGVATLILLAVGAAALVIGRAKLRRKLERLELQQSLERERRRIAQDLHDDVGAGISEIMFLSELAGQERSLSPNPVRSQLDDIARKAQQLATAMDEIVWTVNPKNDWLPNLASYLCDYAREFLRSASVGCRIDRTESLPAVPLTAQARHNLFMAVKEALNNAVKHSGAAEVWLRIFWQEGGATLTVSVEDNGRGFDPAQAQASESGNGLANMQTRLAALGGGMELMSQPGQGTRVCFKLPLEVPVPARSADRSH